MDHDLPVMYFTLFCNPLMQTIQSKFVLQLICLHRSISKEVLTLTSVGLPDPETLQMSSYAIMMSHLHNVQWYY